MDLNTFINVLIRMTNHCNFSLFSLTTVVKEYTSITHLVGNSCTKCFEAKIVLNKIEDEDIFMDYLISNQLTYVKDGSFIYITSPAMKGK